MMNLPRMKQHEGKPLEENRLDLLFPELQICKHETNVTKLNTFFSTRGALAFDVYPQLLYGYYLAS